MPVVDHSEVPALNALHHVRLPVSNVLASRDWYVDVFGFQPILVAEEEDAVTGVVLEHPSGVVLGLHQDPNAAAALRRFVVIGLCVPNVRVWIEYLDRRGVAHGKLEDLHLGRGIQVPDPDGILVELQTCEQPSAGDA